MKELFISIIIASLFVISVQGADCPANEIDPTPERVGCTLIKPAETFVDDVVTVNCTKQYTAQEAAKHDGKMWEPLFGSRITVTGYDEWGEALQGEAGSIGRDGTYEFTPLVSGNFLIQVSSCGYAARFEVLASPEDKVEAVQEPYEPEDAEQDIGGAGDSLEIADEEEPIHTPTGNVVAADDTPQNTQTQTHHSLFDFVINETREEEKEETTQQASQFAVLLISIIMA